MSVSMFWGGVERVSAGFEAFGTQDGKRVPLGTWPSWDEATDIYARWSEAHPRPPRPQPSHDEMLAEIRRVHAAASAT